MKISRLLLVLASACLSCGGLVVVENDGASGSSSSSSSASSSSSSSSVGTGATCPEFPPINAQCPVEGQTCPVPFGCCGGSAVCTAGVWSYAAVDCAEACIHCFESFACVTGSVCVSYQGDFKAAYECRADPCPGSSDCACAQPLCDEMSLICAIHEPMQISCACIAC